MILVSRMRNTQRGITMMELLIVVAIISMLAAIAYPSYMQYVVNTKRTMATTTLLQIADRQQQFFMDNKRFTGDLTNLGFGANPYVVSDDGNSAAAGDGDAIYSFSLSNVAATTYTITAAPLHGQLARDTDCGSLTLNQGGSRGNSAGGDDCW